MVFMSLSQADFRKAMGVFATGVSIITVDLDGEIHGMTANALTSVSLDAEAKAGARFERTKHGTPVLHGALAYLECCLQSTHPAGDHTIFIAEVEDVVVREGEPLLFFRGNYRKIGGESSNLE
jgi:flavin reductase (DIM6/NTAB) family NADH-FMN oxidoreductase RutF